MMFVLYLLGSALAILGLYALLKTMGRAESATLSSLEEVEALLIEEGLKTKPRDIGISTNGDKVVVVLEDDRILLLRALGHFWQWREVKSSFGVSRNGNRISFPRLSYTDPAVDFYFSDEADAIKWADILARLEQADRVTGMQHA
jgi:hypothetical protein